LLCCSGFLILYSASGGTLEPWASKQIANFFLFMPIALVIALIDLKIIFRFSYLLYFIILILLIWVS